MKIGRIFYLVPPNPKPCGGILTRYLHCSFLRKAGFEAYPLHRDSNKVSWFDMPLEVLSYKDVGFTLNPDDIVVASEVFLYEGLLFKNAHKLMLAQNWFSIYHQFYEPKWYQFSLRRKRALLGGFKPRDRGRTYLDLGYEKVMTVSQYVSDYILKEMGVECTTITNGIDLTQYTYQPEKKTRNTILCLPRKNKADIEQIRALVEREYTLSPLTWIYADDLPQKELIERYQQADIFLSTGYPEGFGRPHIEAMACGCAVVGFTGGGASEFMRDNETALVAADGDCTAAAGMLVRLLTDNALKERIRAGSLKMSIKYGLDSMEKKVVDFYRALENEG